MPRLIDADDLWFDIMMLPHNGDMISSEEAEQAIKDAPTIDPESLRKKGKWERRMVQDSRIYTDMAWCSNCGYHMIFKRQFDNFCPNCGADMRGDA